MTDRQGSDNIRLLWRVEPWSAAAPRLLEPIDSNGMAPTDEVAVLYQLLDGTTPAALTWVHAPEPDHRENLQVECSRENTFAAGSTAAPMTETSGTWRWLGSSTATGSADSAPTTGAAA